MVKFFQQLMDSFNIFNLISFYVVQNYFFRLFLISLFSTKFLSWVHYSTFSTKYKAMVWQLLTEIDLRHQESIDWSGILDVPQSEHSALLPEALSGTSVSPRLSWWSQMDKVVLTTYWVLINIKKRQTVIFWFLQRFVI